MRLAIAMVVLVPLTLPMGSAQPTGPIASDPLGDVTGAATYPSGTLDAFDLVSLGGAIQGPDLVLDLAVADFDGENRPLLDSAFYRIDYGYGGAVYRIDIRRQFPLPVFQSGPIHNATLSALQTQTGTYRSLVSLAVEEPLSDTLRVKVPLLKIADAAGVPTAGGTLVDLVASSYHDQDSRDGEPGQELVAGDRMPNAGTASFELSISMPTSTSVLLESPRPIRVSNGNPGAVTFPFNVTNVGQEGQLLRLSVRDLPEGWTASLLDEVISLDPGVRQSSLVAVWLPGLHGHGGSQGFKLVGEATDSDWEGSLTFSVHFTDLPQPAGHHPTLYIHSTAPSQGQTQPATGITGNQAFMNTLEEDPSNSGQPVSPGQTTAGGGWLIQLSPGLALGLDFQTDRTAYAKLRFTPSHPLPLERVTLTPRLLLSDGTAIASAEPKTMSVPGPVDVEFDLRLDAQADLLPLNDGRNLLLEIDLQQDGPEEGVWFPLLQPGGFLRLPLVEYQDPVPIKPPATLLVEVSPQSIPAPPGSSVSFAITITNQATEALRVELSSIGDLPSWHARFDRTSLSLTPKQSETVEFLVDVPEDTGPGVRLSSFIAVRLDGLSAASLQEVAVLVDPDASPPAVDDSTPSHKTPPWPVSLLAVALLALSNFKRSRT